MKRNIYIAIGASVAAALAIGGIVILKNYLKEKEKMFLPLIEEMKKIFEELIVEFVNEYDLRRKVEKVSWENCVEVSEKGEMSVKIRI